MHTIQEDARIHLNAVDVFGPAADLKIICTAESMSMQRTYGSFFIEVIFAAPVNTWSSIFHASKGSDPRIRATHSGEISLAIREYEGVSMASAKNIWLGETFGQSFLWFYEPM